MAHAHSSSTASTTTSDTDQKFMREMCDHHLGVIEVARTAKKADGASADVRAKAEEMARKQQTEIEKMQQMLEQNFGDRYQPKVSAKNQRMVERVRDARGSSLDSTFYETVIEHHEEGIKMMDREMPRLSDPELKKMAEKMKSDQQKEVKQLQQKLQTAGAR